MPNKKISQLDVRSSPTLADLLAIADPSTGYAYKITGTNLQTVLEIPNKVPYTGATAAVNLGAYGIISDYLQLSTTPTASGAVGRTLWNDSIGSTQTTLKGGSVVLKNGVDLVARVVNKVTPAATLTKATYKAVRVSGAQGQRLAIAYAQANTDNNSADTIGLVCETIAANQEGFIITVGQLSGINTTGSLQGETWADGDVLYLSPTTAGNLTNIKPTGATGHIVVIGYVEYSHAINGSIYVKIMNGWELDELHNVYINAVANNDVLVYESSSTLWKNKTISTILGYTPQATITLTTTGNSGASTFVSNTLNIPNYTLAGLGGQAQLNGTGFVKATGTTISYDNTTYATDSLVVHLSGAENIIGVKTFQNSLKTTVGNNLLNTGGGNTVIGYTADPATSATYELDVNGAININTGILNKKLYTDTSAGVQSFKIGTGYELYGTLHSAGGYLTYITTNGFASGWNIIIGTNTAQSLIINNNNVKSTYDLQALAGMSNVTGNGSMSTYFSSPYEGFKPVTTNGWGFAIFNSANSPMMAVKNTGQMQLSGYTSTSVFTGTVAGLLGFDSSGNVITTSASGGGISGSGTAGQVTYWSGTSAVTGSSNLFWDNTNGRLGIGTSTIPANIGKLYIQENAAQGVMTIQNSSILGWSSFGINNSSGSLVGGFGWGNASAAVLASVMYFDVSGNNPFIIRTNNNERIRFFGNGNVGINTGSTDGGQRLQVIGSMRVGTTAASAMYWDDTNNRLGIGTSSPGFVVDIQANTNGLLRQHIKNLSNGTVAQTAILLRNDADMQYMFGITSTGFTTTSGLQLGDAFVQMNSTTAGTYLTSSLVLRTVYDNAIKLQTNSTTRMTIKADGKINISSLPTSSAGLSSGDLWNNLGIINIV